MQTNMLFSRRTISTARTLSSVLFTLLWISTRQLADAQTSFANITLKANGGDLSAVIYLPQGLKPDEPTYYLSTRFDHGSMIGNIQRTVRNEITGERRTHLLYGTKQWRVPHDPFWPESGIGLAAEFGVGDDGAFCNWRCGWYGVNEVTNGVLGYQDAKNGDSFLKIGVGELIKGSCPTCDSTDDFKFNSPYEFAKPPVWTLETKEEEGGGEEEEEESNSIVLENEATLDQHGYKLRKEIQLNDDELLVKSTLTNSGDGRFATAWYSHHFFTCDSHPVGKGVGVDLDVTGTAGNYDEPTAWFWSTPLETYAALTANKEAVTVDMNRGVERDVRIKAEFEKDEESRGTFTLHGCETSITESIPEVGIEGGLSMYSFNLYIESGTFSPEPQVLLQLDPGQSVSWTQRLTFHDFDELHDVNGMLLQASLVSAANNTPTSVYKFDRPFFLFALTATCVAFCIQSVWRKKRREQKYTPIPDHNTVDL